jgi:hypothetical protein
LVVLYWKRVVGEAILYGNDQTKMKKTWGKHFNGFGMEECGSCMDAALILFYYFFFKKKGKIKQESTH